LECDFGGVCSVALGAEMTDAICRNDDCGFGSFYYGVFPKCIYVYIFKKNKFKNLNVFTDLQIK